MRARIFPWLISMVAQIWVTTLRVRLMGAKISDPSIAAFWHGDQLPLLRARPNASETVAVSLSRDGQLQSRVLSHLGMNVVRGSSSRGGFTATRGLISGLARGEVVLMAVDGPRGPRCQVKPGAVFLARKTGVPVYPVAVAVGSAMRLSRSWDLFLLPWPFARVCIWIGEAWYPSSDVSVEVSCHTLGELLTFAERRAREELGTGFS